MTAGHGLVREGAVGLASGELGLELALPPDLFDVLASDDEEARRAFVEAFTQMLPDAQPADLDYLVEGLMLWRADLIEAGFVMHGVVAVPDPPDSDTPVHWHILAGLIDVPSAEELDIGVVTERVLRASPVGDSYTEAFESAMGWGTGLITLSTVPRLAPPAGFDAQDEPASLPELGVAAAVAGHHHDTKALLVFGLSIDPVHVVELAAVVALIAGQSRIIRPAGDPETETAG